MAKGAPVSSGNVFLRLIRASSMNFPTYSATYNYLAEINEFRPVCVYFPPFLNRLPTNHQTSPKMAYNLLSNIILYFMKCTHFSYRYSYMSILCHHDFSNDLIRSLVLFDHPCSKWKCGHLNVKHYGIKIYVNG